MPKGSLPDYKGQLGAAPWSEIKSLTPETRRALAAAALRGCPVCWKSGFIEPGDGTAQICHCVNRREDGAP